MTVTVCDRKQMRSIKPVSTTIVNTRLRTGNDAIHHQQPKTNKLFPLTIMQVNSKDNQPTSITSLINILMTQAQSRFKLTLSIR